MGVRGRGCGEKRGRSKEDGKGIVDGKREGGGL